MKGTLFAFKISMDSAVCGLNHSLMSTTRIAMSAKEPPRFLSEVKAACPGESMNNKPGMVNPDLMAFKRGPQIVWIVLMGTMLQPMAWVIPPASLATTAVPLILSKMLDFPWSTWPSTVTIGRLVAIPWFYGKFYLNLMEGGKKFFERRFI